MIIFEVTATLFLMLEVAAPLGVADAVEGGVLGEATEGGFVGLGELFQFGFAGIGEGDGNGGLIVIGTGQLADVAAEDITAGVERRRQFGCTVLDGVVGGAATGIDLVRDLPFPADNGVVRTGIDTTAAVAAAVGQRGVIAVALGSGNEFADIAIGAPLRIDQQGVLAKPSQPCTLRPVTVADGGGIDKGTCREVRITFRNTFHQLVQHPFQAFVIVLAIGVLRNAVGTLHAAVGFVGQQDRNDTAGPFDQQTRILPLIGMALHIVHVGMETGGEPLLQREFVLR